MRLYIKNKKRGVYFIMCRLSAVKKEDYPQLRALYRMYVREIRRLEEHVKPHETESELESIDGRTDYFIVNDSNQIIGFILLGFYPNSFSRHDIFIGEFYICPEYRRHGYGTDAVKELIKMYSEFDISMFVLKKNLGAKLFWNYVFSKYEYVERTRAGGTKAKTKNCEWFYWVKA